MNNNFLSKVFGWIFAGLLVTFITGFIVAGNDTMVYNIFSTNLYFLFIIAEILLVVILSTRIRKMQTMMAIIFYLLYSFMTGLTFSIFFIAYGLGSVITAFGLTGILFGLFALYGRLTKKDLSKMSSIFMMGLLGIFITSIINIFLGNSMLDIIICAVGVIIFLGLTAYDMQKIKYYQMTIPNENNAVIISAFELYLDFINIFIKLLRLMNRNRD